MTNITAQNFMYAVNSTRHMLEISKQIQRMGTDNPVVEVTPKEV